eukprot:scaffold82129_cov30-Phaeocystis_antarctica.AAC.3
MHHGRRRQFRGLEGGSCCGCCCRADWWRSTTRPLSIGACTARAGASIGRARNQVVSLGLFCIGTVDFLLAAALFDDPRLRRIGLEGGGRVGGRLDRSKCWHRPADP